MSNWPSDLAKLTVAEIVQLAAENRKWGKELRIAAAALVKRRLALQISLEDYQASRQRGKDEAAECRRRAAVLGG